MITTGSPGCGCCRSSPGSGCRRSEDETRPAARTGPGARTGRPDGDPRAADRDRRPRLPRGLALLDAPDIDSLVVENRTARRRADLRRRRLGDGHHRLAVRRRRALAPAAHRQGVRRHARHRARPGAAPGRSPRSRGSTAALLTKAGLGDVPRFTIPELPESAGGGSGLLPDHAPSPRCSPGSPTARRTRPPGSRPSGAPRPACSTRSNARMPELAGAVAAQYAAAVRLTGAVEDAYEKEGERVRGRLGRGAVLAGDARTRWRGYPLDSTAERAAGLPRRSPSPRCSSAPSPPPTSGSHEAWRREPAAGRGRRRRPAADREAAERIGMAVRRWRRVLEELAEEEVAAAGTQRRARPRDGRRAAGRRPARRPAGPRRGGAARRTDRRPGRAAAARPGRRARRRRTSTACCTANATAGSPRSTRSK